MYFNFQISYNNQVHVHVTTVKVNGTGNKTCKYCNMCIFFCYRYDEELAQQDVMGGDPRKLGPGTFRGKRDGSRPSPATWKWLYSKYMYIRNLVWMDRCWFITYVYSLNGLRTVVKVWEISASAQKQIKYMYRNLDWSERNLE